MKRDKAGAPILAPYQITRPGYEFLVAETLKSDKDMNCFPVNEDGYQQVCLWNIFEQKKDPADTDEEKQKINKMQQALGKICDNDRYVRIQIACLARCYWTFPENVNLVIDGIAKGRPNLTAAISCEPPWAHGILPLLRKRHGYVLDQYSIHHSESIVRDEQIFLYIKILNSWLVDGDLHRLEKRLGEKNSVKLAETIYRYLRTPTRLKRLYVQKLCWSLSFWTFSSQTPHEERRKRWSEIDEVLNNNIQKELGATGEVNEELNRIDDSGSCHHAFFRHIEHVIAHIGAGKPVVLPGAGEERKRIHNTIVNYVHSLVSWLAGRPIPKAISIWPDGKATIKYLYGMLGQPTPRKRWLVASLWKKMNEDRAHRGRGALDTKPQLFACPPDALLPENGKIKIRRSHLEK